MFFPLSRYLNVGTYTVTLQNGTVVTVTKRPQSVQGPLLGYHRVLRGQRLDHIASHYLNDPAGFWRLCDANDAVVPDALAAEPLVGIPA